MAGSLGLGIGFEEHHVEPINVGEGGGGWQGDVCDEGTWDPDCECCCHIFPPASHLLSLDPDWTLAWGIDSQGNIVPEAAVYAASDGWWTYDAITQHLIPVSVLLCQGLTATAGIDNCTPADC